MNMKRYVYSVAVFAAFAVVALLRAPRVRALEAENSVSEAQYELIVISSDPQSYQNEVGHITQALDDAVLQADKIERSLLAEYKNDNDIIVGVYSYGSLKDLRLTKHQAEVIKNGYIPMLGNAGDPAIVNTNPRTNVQYAEINGGGSGGRSITACYNPNVPRKPGENDVLVKGSMYGMSNGGYVCADPANIRMNCSMVSEANPCINGTFQLDTGWLLSIGVNLAEIRRQIEENKQPAPSPAPQPTPDPGTPSQ